ncbi:MAG: alpha/beta hydrolase [Candidatus Izemoplasmataceae bacterium]
MKVIREEIFIEPLNRSAIRYIALPKHYDESNKHYPVLYMHDGHNLFFEEDSYAGVTWGVLDAYNNYKDLKDIIIVGLSCANGIKRLNEYGPYPFEINVFNEEGIIPGGKGHVYLDYLVNELKPMIDSNYRTLKDKDHTAIMGSSMGGVISLYAGCKYPETFGLIGSVSGAYYVSPSAFRHCIKESDLSHIKKLYIDTGDEEVGGGNSSDYMISNAIMVDLLRQKLTQDRLQYQIIAGGKHHETDWAKRLPDILRYLFS